MRHIPVLLKEVINSLQLKPGMNIVDCTLGDAGHSEKILKEISPNGKLLGIDADPESLLRAKKFLHQFEQRIILVRDNFVGLSDVVARYSPGPIHGILLDLGWSTPQFEERKRGFSFFHADEPLDMRYDKRMRCDHPVEGVYYEGCTAAHILNTTPEAELSRIFKDYGEERYAKEIARAVVEKRKEYDLETVGDFVPLILEVYRQKLKSKKEIPWIGGLHPATRVFQALRISVNEELTAIAKVLPQAIDVLESGGRLAIISFHSLEDRFIKHFFKTIKIITKKPIVCSEEESRVNPPSGSAKLRVVEKI